MSKKKPGVVPPPDRLRSEVERFLSGNAEEAARAVKSKKATLRKEPLTQKELYDMLGANAKPSKQFGPPKNRAAPRDDGPLVVLTDVPCGLVVRTLRQRDARTFAFRGIPGKNLTTKPLQESLEIDPGQAMAATASAIGSMSPGAALGAIAGGVLGALLTQKPRKQNPVMPPGSPSFFTKPSDIDKVFVEPYFTQAFALSEDTIAMTGVSAGATPAWALCLGSLTRVWVDPYVVQAAMVRDQALFALLERTGEGMREASAKGGTFDLWKVATDVRALLAPGR